MLLRVVTLFMLLVYLYVGLLLLTMSLFNLIILGVLYVYFLKLYTFCVALEMKSSLKYRTGPFRRFIERENLRYYRTMKKLELVGGEMGKWIELQLPQDIEEREKERDIEDRLFGAPRSTTKSINRE
jgi:hypothetical protein